MRTMLKQYELNKMAAMRSTICCATCGKPVTKNHPAQAFCPPVRNGKSRKSRCKDRFHNMSNPSRRERVNNYLETGTWE